MRATLFASAARILFAGPFRPGGTAAGYVPPAIVSASLDFSVGGNSAFAILAFF